METTVLSAAEALEYGEFKRTRREAEVALTLKKLSLDASRRETDKTALKNACDCAQKLHAHSVMVSPVNVAFASRRLRGGETAVACYVGGIGESLISIKKTEAKKAVKQGAGEIFLIPCYSALFGGNLPYLKREIKRVKKAVKKGSLSVVLDDHALGRDEISRGVRAACEARANAVCVRGELANLQCAVRASAGRLRVDVSHVENAEQLRLLFKAGATNASTCAAEEIARELHRAAEESGAVVVLPPPVPNVAPIPPAKEKSDNE